VFACGGGLYLLTNPRFGPAEPVRAVGWAESDYWARRTWDNPPFRGDLTIPPLQWDGPPSLTFLGRPARSEATGLSGDEIKHCGVEGGKV